MDAVGFDAVGTAGLGAVGTAGLVVAVAVGAVGLVAVGAVGLVATGGAGFGRTTGGFGGVPPGLRPGAMGLLSSFNRSAAMRSLSEVNWGSSSLISIDVLVVICERVVGHWRCGRSSLHNGHDRAGTVVLVKSAFAEVVLTLSL